MNCWSKAHPPSKNVAHMKDVSSLILVFRLIPVLAIYHTWKLLTLTDTGNNRKKTHKENDMSLTQWLLCLAMELVNQLHTRHNYGTTIWHTTCIGVQTAPLCIHLDPDSVWMVPDGSRQLFVGSFLVTKTDWIFSWSPAK